MGEQVGDWWKLDGHAGELRVRVWPSARPKRLVLICHGYGEHIGRYEHVAAALVEGGATVCGPDHVGHGRSAGERVVIADYEAVVDDVRLAAERVRVEHPDLPLVVIGHSMGGTIATRYAQRHRPDLAGLVLSGPVLGRFETIEQLLALPEIPDIPIDIDTLSRDPEVGAAYAADELVWHGPFRRPTLLAWQRVLDDIAAGPALGDLPVLWVHGEDDPLVPLAGTRAGIAGLGASRLVERTYPGARHELFNEINADEVLAEVTAFVERVTPAAS
ncbi:alpha/beta hydrolase [Planosporangium flavigriseum]|uniref:Lysophospholipase n=1 Tax=Planosporangium flavigriseum TaxID=373681 RepID=A0A8J3PMX3_9ACTN|nr:alpha/beta hydrolase [Planosporangium flavigriseum]NJC67729.1 alpha/beta hydrolase [Planosporangium flavigriseum]GIG76006.1 lysophospholipase [Planosporangium flavigriseum]